MENDGGLSQQEVTMMEGKTVTTAVGTNGCVVLQEGAQPSYSLCSAQVVQ